MASSTAFTTLEAVPTDPIFALLMTYINDVHPQKVSLGVGVYKTDEGQNWTLPAVRQAMKVLADDPSFDHDYLPLSGYRPFIDGARELIFGAESSVDPKRIASIQTISGTGAVHVGARLLLEQLPPLANKSEKRRVWVSNPTWGNHHLIFDTVISDKCSSPAEQKFYPYFKFDTRSLDFEGMIQTLESEGKAGDVILLHACAHNPTGLEPTADQWKAIADVCKRKGFFPFFDCAYQGFASGSLDRDAWAIREFVAQGLEVAVAQSFSKNLGLYGQRVGAFHLVCADESTAQKAQSQIVEIQRSELSMPPAYGAKIATIIMQDPALREQWKQDMKEMSGRIIAMRHALYDELKALGTPGKWEHIIEQVGMFSYTGLTPEQVKRLKDEFHIYMLESSRASISGLNTKNVQYVAKAIDAVVRESYR